MAGTSSKIPVEIISDDEMASIDAALAFAARSLVTPAASVPAIHSPISASWSRRIGTSFQSVPVRAKRSTKKKKKSRADNTLLHRFRSKRGLFVTDITKTEWCDKQMEFSLLFEEWKNHEAKPDLAFVYGGGGSWKSKAMKAGIDRHFQLEQEVLEPMEVNVKSSEDYMALKLVDFINGVNQLLFEGLTRELPIISFDFAQGIWMVGKIDEIRMPKAKKDHNPINGRIQLMCYKYLWDNLVVRDFPSKRLFEYFELNPRRNLCKDLRTACVDSGISALTIADVVICYQNMCKLLPRANDKLVLRYESQRDHSLLEEEKFVYEGSWIKNEIRICLEFWLGKREASSVDEEDQWKCGFCDFTSQCPAYIGDSGSTETLSEYDYSSDCCSVQ
ncbi:defects in morphology protein 1 precursor [Medicago truncatula]|uniref:Defects in morphology protein 1 n=2 Tax=Medicago truncatula TaxID=3880 RepID=G7IA65_MEDTR|nr:defects in morphology protein 1 precursor [Medicago truncatula]